MPQHPQRFLRSKRLRALLWYAADGRCTQCGEPLEERWHADQDGAVAPAPSHKYS